MARTGAAIIAGLSVALALGGCGSTGSSGSSGGLFSTSPLDYFKSNPKIATASSDVANPASAIDTDYDCPEVKVRSGAATLMIGSKPGEGEPAALDVRYQGSITRTARECHLNGNTLSMKIGVEGRIITGPAGGPGSLDVPIRFAVVHEGVNPKVVASTLGHENVSITGDRANFAHVEPDLSFPLPSRITDISSYVVYVGFDAQVSQPEKKKQAPAHKPKKRPTNKPAQS